MLATFSASPASAHPGRTAADGCHNNRSAGERHCHNGSSKPLRASGAAPRDYFPNCASARAAGVAPLRKGQRGYGRHLDRDNDGIACET
ncbi:calcium-binding protein [Croceicoccus marinus]|uniref:Calcium-binding protein n=1 Tax=Croceicoccus marinus TaxID=450378 RepID=A0A1Z1FF05_9SPHN|nr:calcium-binding protein [Croceicoccus marinus]